MFCNANDASCNADDVLALNVTNDLSLQRLVSALPTLDTSSQVRCLSASHP